MSKILIAIFDEPKKVNLALGQDVRSFPIVMCYDIQLLTYGTKNLSNIGTWLEVARHWTGRERTENQMSSLQTETVRDGKSHRVRVKERDGKSEECTSLNNDRF